MSLPLSFCLLSPKAFREQLDAALLAFNLTEAISTLTQLRDQFNSLGQTALETSTQTIIDELVDIRDNQLPAIETAVVSRPLG